MKLKLLAAAIALAASGLASATSVLIFGQTSGASIVATESGGTTTIGVGSGGLIITQIAPGVTNPINGTLSLSLTSIAPAILNANVVTQYYSGSFSVYSSGVDVLTATFSNARMSGSLGGGALEFGNSTDQDGTLLFTSDLIPASDLGILRAMSFSFTNLNVPVAIADGSLASFTSNFSGNDSANLTSTTVPEPSTVLLSGLGLLGLVASRRTRKV
jgi:hypothetical protein